MKPQKRNSRRIRRCIFLALLGLFVIGAMVVFGKMLSQRESKISRSQPTTVPPDSLQGLQTKTISEIESTDIALMNLLCAQGLPGAEGINISQCLELLDKWADRVGSETKRHWLRYEQNPAQFQHSRGVFQMIMLGTVLQGDFRVGYNASRMTPPGEFEPNEVFFADSRDVFLHGLLSGNHQGTCSSLPILYLAIGRRLGYPLKLATAKAHLFLRWEDARIRFNIECSGRGVGIYDDDHYRQWPIPMTAQEETENGYLKSLSNAETLAVFLNLRGQCLLTAAREDEALHAHSEAVRIAPHSKSCKLVLQGARTEISQRQGRVEIPVPNLPPFRPPPTLAIEPNPLNRIRTP